MKSDTQVTARSFVLAADEGQAFWFLNTLTINKIRQRRDPGPASIVDDPGARRLPPPPHVHEASDEAFLVLDGEFDGFLRRPGVAGVARSWCPCRGSRTVTSLAGRPG